MSERYEIQEKIGQGGAGAVYRAKDTQLGREVALKRLRPAKEFEGDKGEAYDDEGLMEEAKILSSLQHPNIVTVYDTGTDDKGPYVVMEFLKGETFDETVKRGVLTVPDFREVVLQTLEGLIAAQELDLVHRDLKPANMMLNWLPSGKFQIKILDFGLAKFSQLPTTQTSDQEDGIMGSIHFMAPEQFERLPLDARTDLYSLGCIYYYALTGKYPFRGESGAQVMASHLQNRVYPLQQVRPDLPRYICSWVMWLISREMKDRPSSAKEALDVFMSEKDVGASAATPMAVPQGPYQTVQGAMPAAPPPGMMHGGTVAPAPPVTAAPTVQPVQPAVVPHFEKPPNFFTTKAGIISLICMTAVSAIIVTWVVISSGEKRRLRDEFSDLVSQSHNSKPKGKPATVVNVIKVMTEGELDTDMDHGEHILRNLQGNGIDEALLGQLEEQQNKRVTLALVRALGSRGYKKAVPGIIKAYESGDGELRMEAIGYLSQLASKHDLNALIRLFEIESIDRREAQALQSTIVDLAKRENAEGPATISLLRTAREVDSEIIEPLILGAIGHLGGNTAYANLVRELDPSKPDESIPILSAFGNWPNSKPIEDIMKFTRKVESGDVRMLAVLSFAKLGARYHIELTDEENTRYWREAIALLKRSRDKADVLKRLRLIPKRWALNFADEMTRDPEKLVANTAEGVKSAIQARIDSGAE